MDLKVGSIEVLHKSAMPLTSPGSNYNGFHPSTTLLPKGFKKAEVKRAFSAATIWERDVAIPLRDGKTLRGDVFRPAETVEKVPVMMVWSPYGKSGNGALGLHLVQGRVGIPESRLSGFENFEAPDPAEWTAYGYAVVNVDARGLFNSEGNIRWHGTAEGRDGYDAVEFMGTRPWANGRVALIGNSWLATSQWYIASERPPHLTCILPLEGLSDVYRETLCRGGVPYLPFWTFLMGNLFGQNLQEDVISMVSKYPLMNEYWEDKRAKSHLIQCPAYILASMSTGLHTVGSVRCYEDIPHSEKWLRLHPTQEWHDLYQDETIQDLKKFLDFYTKGIQNGWEKTPKARVSVLRYNQAPLKNLAFSDWPIPGTKYQAFYFSSQGHLTAESQSVALGTESYQSDVAAQQADADSEEVAFTYTFPTQTTLIGASKAILWMSCPEHNDFDVFVSIRKANREGKVLRNVNIPLAELSVSSADEVDDVNVLKYLGPTGILRASHRTLDPKLSKTHWPAHDHTRQSFVPPGEIVRLEIGIWPSAIRYEAGEKMIIKVAGHQMTLAEFVPLRGGFLTGNKGRHVLHFGGQYDSHILIPTIEV